MNRYLLAIFVPPFAVCRYGCAGCCAAPIGVFWITGLICLAYGYAGGPLRLEGVSWGTLGLGTVLWLVAVSWAELTLKAADDDRCERRGSALCNRIIPGLGEDDPMDEVKKAREI